MINQPSAQAPSDHDDLNVDEELDAGLSEMATEPPLTEPDKPKEEPLSIPSVKAAPKILIKNESVIDVEILDEEIMSLQFRQILSTPELTDRLSEELEQQSVELLRRRKMIDKRLGQISQQAEVIQRAQTHHARRNGQPKSDIQRHLQTQFATRLVKAQAAQEFLKGVSASEVLKAINPKSKLDQVMGAKRGDTSSTRKYVPLGR